MFEKRHRVFIAINLPNDVKKSLSGFQQKFADVPAKWTDTNNLHITLEFLGYITDQELADVCKITKEVAERHNSFSVNLNKVVYGPPNKMPPRMIWATGEKSKELSDLKNDLQKSLLESVRFAPDEKSFAPHITLARISEWEFKKIEPEERPEVNEDVDFLFSAESIEVMESVSKRGGPQYTVLESHQLGN